MQACHHAEGCTRSEGRSPLSEPSQTTDSAIFSLGCLLAGVAMCPSSWLFLERLSPSLSPTPTLVNLVILICIGQETREPGLCEQR